LTGELELAVAGSLAFGRAAARAVDRYDCRPVRKDKVNDLPARQAALERQNPAIIDDGYVEALSLPAHINASPHSHGSKHAPPRCRSHMAQHGGSDTPVIALGAATGLAAERNSGEVPAGASSELWPYEIRAARPEETPDRWQMRIFTPKGSDV
jgi:hypothetical protein